MKNKLTDLNNHLFEQLERLNDEDLKGEGLNEEINRSKAISDIATNIIKNGQLTLDAYELAAEYGVVNKRELVRLIGNGDKLDT